MSFGTKKEKLSRESDKERMEELEETVINKRTEVDLHCNETGNQFIEDCKFNKYVEGTSEAESPITGEKFKVTSLKTTNEEGMKWGLLGTEGDSVASAVDDGKYKKSSKGQRTWTTILLSIQSALIAWLLMVWIQGWEFGRSLQEPSIPFATSLTATATAIIMIYVMGKWHQKNDNWYFLKGICVGHSEDHEMHYVIPVTSDNYKDLFTMWYGELDESVKQSLDKLGVKYQEKIDMLKDEKREKEIEKREMEQMNAEKVAESYSRKRSVREYDRRRAKSIALKAVGATSLVMITGFVLFMYFG